MLTKITMILALMTVLVLFPQGCDDNDSGGVNQAMQERVEQLETQRDRARQEGDRWQGYTMFAVAACGFLLVLGAGLGSSSRKKAREQKKE